MKALTISTLFLTAASFACSSAQNSKQNAAKIIFEKGRVPALTCAAGDPYYFMMQKSTVPAPSLADLQLDYPTKEGDEPELVAPSASYNLRLGICADGDNVVLTQAVVFLGPREFYAMDIPATAKVAGLSELLFSQDYSKLDLEIPYETTEYDGFGPGPRVTDQVLIVRPLKDRPAAFFTFLDGESTDRFIDPLLGIVYGAFELSEDGGTGPDECSASGDIKKNSTYTIADVTFSIDGCYGDIMKAGPTLVKVTVTDNSVHADPSVRAVAIEVPKEAYKSNKNHHWACESLVISLPHATYAMTSSKLASNDGLCHNLPEAPTRNDNDLGLAYRFSYPNLVPVEGIFQDLRHFARPD